MVWLPPLYQIWMNRAALDQASARPATPQTIFYVPGAIALLLQHLAITLSARSMLRERQFGRFELFRVTPITPGEILAGPYIRYSPPRTPHAPGCVPAPVWGRGDTRLLRASAGAVEALDAVE